jgi:hypothetical protein
LPGVANKTVRIQLTRRNLSASKGLVVWVENGVPLLETLFPHLVSSGCVAAGDRFLFVILNLYFY